MRRAKLLDPQPVPVRTDIFVHNLDARTLENIRCALAQGLVPTAVDFGGDDDSIVILRLDRPADEFKNPAFCVLDPNEPAEVVSI